LGLEQKLERVAVMDFTQLFCGEKAMRIVGDDKRWVTDQMG
jgi:hypothetical protein